MAKVEKSWFERNLYWVIPSIVLFVAGCILMFLIFITQMMKSSGAYQLSLKHIEQSEEVNELLGENWSASFFVSGSVSTSMGSGSAVLKYKLKGEKETAKVYVEATKSRGEWVLNVLAVFPESDDPIVITKTKKVKEKALEYDPDRINEEIDSLNVENLNLNQ